MGLKKNLLDLIFPQFCLGCGKEGESFCGDCRGELKISPQSICPICKSADEARHCPGSPLENLWALAGYRDNFAAAAIQKIKYGYCVDLVGKYWQGFLSAFWQKARVEISGRAILIPVPLHRKRFLERGFNQSELVADALSRISDLQVDIDLLKRVKHNEPQVGLSGARRLDNIKGIFEINSRALSDSWGREIILIDDVYTTGSTMAECARVLKAAGFKHVSGLVLAVD